VIPGMNHSQFCSPFKVSGDLQSEISDEDAFAKSSDIISDFLNKQEIHNIRMFKKTNLPDDSDPTEKILSPFMLASKEEEGDLCTRAQSYTVNYLPQKLQNMIEKFNVLKPDSLANLEHSHTKIEINPDSKNMDLTIASYPYYDS